MFKKCYVECHNILGTFFHDNSFETSTDIKWWMEKANMNGDKKCFDDILSKLVLGNRSSYRRLQVESYIPVKGDQ